MNVVGRNASRSNSAAHHQRQYSDNLLDSSKWLHSSSQDFGYGSTMNRSLQSNETSTPPISSRSSSLRKNADDFQVSHSELTPGLLDLHSFDTELLSEVPASNLYKGYSFSRRDQGKSFDDFEPYTAANKLSSNTSSVTKSSLVDKERANNVAKIKVLVRKRPLNKREATKKEEDIITIESNYLTVHETKLKVDLTEYVEKHEFVFDSVLKEGVSNDEVYSETVEPIVPLIFQRTKATCFAYGQTGSGKTYTMQPLPLKASQDILRLMHHTYRDQGFQLHFSFFEIYGGKLYDLLNERKKLCMREDGKQQVCIVGLEEFNVTDVGTIRDLIEKGSATRSTGTTGANEESSRSHAILQLAIKRSANSSNSKPARLVGKLSFIDLAGSERGADTTDNDKQTRMEGAEINKSLLALKECIRALDSDQNHIPFRGSKLTEVLRDSFVGDSRTVMISCISPSSGSCEHTLNTLRYADRVKSLSKGSSSKKDPLSSRFRESTVLPLTTVLPNEFAFEDSTADALSEKKRFGWPKAYERESSSPHIVDRVPSGRAEGNLAASGYLGSFKGQRGGQNGNVKDSFDCSMETYDVEKPLQMNKNKRPDAYQKSALEDRSRTDTLMKQRDASTSQPNNFHPDDDLIALLKEEEELVSAHRKQVEETMDIVKEEMKLLVEADQPGNQLHEYISKLNSILSQKAAGIIQLQTRLVQFQRRLNENNVLV